MAPSGFRYGQVKKKGFAPKGPQQKNFLHGIVFTDTSTQALQGKKASPPGNKTKATAPQTHASEAADEEDTEGVSVQDLPARPERQTSDVSKTADEEEQIQTHDVSSCVASTSSTMAVCLGSASSTMTSESHEPDVDGRSKAVSQKGRYKTGLVHQQGIQELQPFAYQNLDMLSDKRNQALKRSIKEKVLAQEEKVVALRAGDFLEAELPRNAAISNLYNSDGLVGGAMHGSQKFLHSPHLTLSPTSSMRSMSTMRSMSSASRSISSASNVMINRKIFSTSNAMMPKTSKGQRTDARPSHLVHRVEKHCQEEPSPAPSSPKASSSADLPVLEHRNLESASGRPNTAPAPEPEPKSPRSRLIKPGTAPTPALAQKASKPPSKNKSLAEQWDSLFAQDESVEEMASGATTKDSSVVDKKNLKKATEEVKNKKNFWSWMLHAASCASDFATSNNKVALGRGLKNRISTDQPSIPKQNSPKSGFLQRQQDFRRESRVMRQQQEAEELLKQRKTATKTDIVKQFGGSHTLSAAQHGKKGDGDKGSNEPHSPRHAGDHSSELSTAAFARERRKCVVSKLMVNTEDGSVEVGEIGSWARTLDTYEMNNRQVQPASEARVVRVTDSDPGDSFDMGTIANQLRLAALKERETIFADGDSSREFGKKASQARTTRIVAASPMPAAATDTQASASTNLRQRTKSMSHVLSAVSAFGDSGRGHAAAGANRGRRKSVSHLSLKPHSEKKDRRPSALFVDFTDSEGQVEIQLGEFSGCPETNKERFEKDLNAVMALSEKPSKKGLTPKLLDRIRADNEKAKTAQERHEKAITDYLLLMQEKGREKQIRQLARGNGPKDQKSHAEFAQEFHMPLEDIKFAKQFFDKYDTDKSGTISQSEFRRMLIDISGAESEDVLSEDFFHMGWVKVNTDQTEEIDFEKFIHWFSLHGFLEDLLLPGDQRETRAIARKYGLSVVDVEHLKKTFDTFDADSSGRMEFSEFKTMLQTLMKVPAGLELPAQRVRQFWQEIDEDKGGDVDFEEFLCWYLRYFSLDGNDPDACPVEEFYRNVRQLNPNGHK